MNNDTSLVKVSGILIFLWGKIFNYPYTTNMRNQGFWRAT